MELEFKQDERGGWYAEATANADFNLHLELEEGSGPGVVIVNVSTVSGGKPVAYYSSNITDVFDRDFDAIVYPKYLRIDVGTRSLNGAPGTKPVKGVITEAE